LKAPTLASSKENFIQEGERKRVSNLSNARGGRESNSKGTNSRWPKGAAAKLFNGKESAHNGRGSGVIRNFLGWKREGGRHGEKGQAYCARKAQYYLQGKGGGNPAERNAK